METLPRTVSEVLYDGLAQVVPLRGTELRARFGRLIRDRLGVRPRRTATSRKVISHRQRFVYMGVPKVSSSSFACFFATDVDNEALVFHSDIQQITRDHEEIFEYFTFAFVRNPWARVASCYRDKICGQGATRFTTGTFEGLWRGMPFAEFVEWLHSAPEGQDEAADRHWMSQHRFLRNAVLPSLAFVGKLESLRRDLESLRRQFGWPVWRFPHLNRTDAVAHENARPYRALYDARLKELVAERYRVDIELFDYDF